MYIGSQFGRNSDPKNFWKTYFTSSKIIHAMIKEHGKDCWSYEIIPMFECHPEEVFREEHRLIKEKIEISGKHSILNKFVFKNGKPSFFISKHSEESKKIQSNKANERWSKIPKERRIEIAKKAASTRKLLNRPIPKRTSPSPLKGIKKSDSTKKKMSESRKGISMPHMSKPKDQNNYTFINISNKTEITGKQLELRSLTGLDAQEINNLIKGRVRWSKNWAIKTQNGISSDRERKPNPTNSLCVTCPHCGYTTSPGNAKRWHFENCKTKLSF